MKQLYLASLFVLLAASCSEGGPEQPFIEPDPTLTNCSIPLENIANGAGKDVIPAISDPLLVDANEAGYLADEDRVIGVVVDGEPVAIPHNIMWFHEIVNLEIASKKLSVTYCPLTGSSLAFERKAIEDGEFGVSGLLWQNNLIMFDRTDRESLWPQMSRRAECGPRLGSSLTMHPVLEITWAGWQALHPDTKVMSNNTGFGIGYTNINYPYGNYEEPNNDALLFPLELDTRRPPKARLLGIPDSRLGGLAFLFSELDNGEPVNVVQTLVDIGSVVIFWDNEFKGAMAYSPRVEGEFFNFEVRDGKIVDVETQTTWRVDGMAVEGPMAGTQLEHIESAFVAFWFAWAAFHPETMIWQE